MSLTKLDRIQKEAAEAYESARKAYQEAKADQDEFRKWRKAAFFVLVGAVVILAVVTSL